MKRAPLHVRIRPLAEGDLRELAWRLPGPDLDTHQRRLALQTEGTLLCLVARYDETSIGLVVVALRDGAATLEDLFVLPPFRRRGVAAQLVARAEAAALARGSAEVVAPVPPANRPARRLFAGRGYLPDAKPRRGEPLRLAKRLRSSGGADGPGQEAG